MTPSYQIISGATTAFVICISYTLQVAITPISLVRRLAKTVPTLDVLIIQFPRYNIFWEVPLFLRLKHLTSLFFLTFQSIHFFFKF